MAKKAMALLALVVGLVTATGWAAAAETVPLSLSATVGPEGTTVFVTAPGCQPTPPGELEIFVQVVKASGEVGEGAVAAGTFTAPGQGSVLIPGATPVGGTPTGSLLLTASCNGGTLSGSQLFVLTEPVASAPVVAPARFTG